MTLTIFSVCIIEARKSKSVRDQGEPETGAKQFSILGSFRHRQHDPIQSKQFGLHRERFPEQQRERQLRPSFRR